MKEKIIFCFSGGKDSAITLHELMKTNNYEIVTLLTTVTGDYDRISMHGVRISLLDQQAESIGLPLEKVFISKGCTNEEYESKMRDTLQKYVNLGITSAAFGDIFLEDLKKQREQNLAKIGLKAIFPIWKKDTTKLANNFIDAGFKTVITCVDTEVLDGEFSGRDFDKQFLADLPDEIDPCGEKGEFHSFVYDGPIFSKPILCKKGRRVLRDDRFYFCDLIPVQDRPALKSAV